MRFKFETDIDNVILKIKNYVAENNLPIRIKYFNHFLKISIIKFGTSNFTFEHLGGGELWLIKSDIAWLHKRHEKKVRGEIVSVLESLGGVRV